MEVDISQVASKIVEAVQTGNWRIAAAGLLVIAVWGVRKYTPKLNSRLGRWLNTDRGGTLLVIFGGLTGAVGTALTAGQAITLNLLLAGLTTGVMAAGGWNVVHRLVWPIDKKPAPGLILPPSPPVKP